MNAAHLHIILNHFPIIGTAISIFVLLTGIIMKSDEVKKVSLLVIVLTALVTIPVYISGDSAQAKVEGNYEDVDEDFIEAHEEFAKYSFIAMDILGVLAIGALLRFKKPKQLPGFVVFLMLVFLLVVNGMMAYTANLGGKIHHPEIREDKLPWENSSSKSDDTKGERKEIKDKKEKDDDDGQ